MPDPEDRRRSLAAIVDAAHGRSYRLSEKLGAVHAILANTAHQASDLERATASCREIADRLEQLATELRDAAGPESDA